MSHADDKKQKNRSCCSRPSWDCFINKLDLYKVKFAYLENLNGRKSVGTWMSRSVSFLVLSSCALFVGYRLRNLGMLTSYQSIQEF